MAEEVGGESDSEGETEETVNENQREFEINQENETNISERESEEQEPSTAEIGNNEITYTYKDIKKNDVIMPYLTKRKSALGW